MDTKQETGCDPAVTTEMKRLRGLIDRFASARVQAELAYERDGSPAQRHRLDEREKAAWTEVETALTALLAVRAGRMKREDLIKLAREAAGGPSKPSYCDDPATFEPHEWVLDAMRLAYAQGRREEQQDASLAIAVAVATVPT